MIVLSNAGVVLVPHVRQFFALNVSSVIGHPLNAAAPIDVMASGMVSSVRYVHPLNALSPIVVKEEGSESSVRLELLENAPAGMMAIPSCNDMDVDDVHPAKAFVPIEVTDEGIVMLFSPVQLAKAEFPMDSTELPKFIVSIELIPLKDLLIVGQLISSVLIGQLPNAFVPIDVSDEGIDSDSSCVHPLKAPSPTEVMPSGKTTLFRRLHPLKALFPTEISVDGRVRLDRDEQLENAPSGIVVTPSGIATDSSAVHPLKAASPIELTEAGIVKVVNAVQLAKAPAPIEDT